MIRVLLADDDPLVRSALRLMLAGTSDVELVAEAADGAEVLSLVDKHTPDLVLMDVRMPIMDGIEATRTLCSRPDAPKTLMLTTFQTDEYIVRALRAGATGFVLKHTPPQEIVAAIRKAAAGEPALSPSVTQSLITQVIADEQHGEAQGNDDASNRAHARAQLAKLGSREREVAEAVGEGKTNAQIAAELYMSVPTVKAHVSNILTKLELTNRVQIALTVYDANRG
ncbi:DNA-binding response regulator [Streptomyces sp. ZS0098]|uniref:response regulator transcription factor n=1 Tax=unclassified Streptomyces TaxID=2593676 RepID=UPI000EFBB553|nr:response regulator transcription factor [Streptomyces sp. ZS0098]RMI89451.1 DNA-binding response regulator [Streptomyces sp. ZS0098]